MASAQVATARERWRRQCLAEARPDLVDQVATAAEIFRATTPPQSVDRPAPPQDAAGGLPLSLQACPTLVERLTRRFGLGDRPARRKALYARLDALVAGDEDGPVMRVIRAAAAASSGARKPGHYFAAAVCGMLRDLGLAVEGGV